MNRLLTAATLCAVFSFMGCAGCEEPEEGSAPAAPAAQSGGQTSNAGGSSDVASPESMKAGSLTGPREQSRFDTDKGAGKKGALGQAAETAQAPALHQPARVKPVAADKLIHVLGLAPAGRYSIVFETKDGCRDCVVLAPVVSSLVEENSTLYDFYSVDLTSVDASSSTVLPILLMYQGAQQTSRVSGLPFARDAKIDGKPETDLSYRKRLRRWLQDALSSKNLQWAKQ